jgi:hypothetical protein
LPPGARKLNRSSAAIEFLVRLDPDRPAPFTTEELDPAPGRLLDRTEVPWRVTRKRREKEVDLRPAIDDLAWLSTDDVPDRPGFGRAGGRVLRVRILQDVPQAHARPEEVVAAALGRDPGIQAIDVARVGLLRREGGRLVGIFE